MRKFAICVTLSLVCSGNSFTETVDYESISVETESTVVEERLHYQRTVTKKSVETNGIVIIPGDKPGAESENPFEDPNHFEVTENTEDQSLVFRTKNLTLQIAKDGATINGEFHKWRHKNYSWGIFDRSREIDIQVNNEAGVQISVDVNWNRKVWGSKGNDKIQISKSEFRTTEEVTDSILGLANDFNEGILKLDTAKKINQLVGLINPFLQEPYTKRLVVSENLSQREQLIGRMISQATELHGADAENEFLTKKFVQHYKIGFTADELIKIAEACHGADAENEILFMGAQAYLYFYSEDDVKKVAKAAHGADAENRILMLLTERGAGSEANVIREIPGTSEDDLERSKFVSDLLKTAMATSTSSARNRILLEGFENNLDLKFSLTDILRISRATTTSSARNIVILKAARYYGPRFTQDDFRILANATSTSSARNEVLSIAAEHLNNRGGFYDSDIKDDYPRNNGDYKDGHQGSDLKESHTTETVVDVKVKGRDGSNVRVDVDVQ